MGNDNAPRVDKNLDRLERDVLGLLPPRHAVVVGIRVVHRVPQDLLHLTLPFLQRRKRAADQDLPGLERHLRRLLVVQIGDRSQDGTKEGFGIGGRDLVLDHIEQSEDKTVLAANFGVGKSDGDDLVEVISVGVPKSEDDIVALAAEHGFRLDEAMKKTGDREPLMTLQAAHVAIDDVVETAERGNKGALLRRLAFFR